MNRTTGVTLAIAALFGAAISGGCSKSYPPENRAEVMSWMVEIFHKQESFFMTYATYRASATDEHQFTGVPLTGEDLGYYAWDVKCPGDSQWCALGFRPVPDKRPSGATAIPAQLQTIGWAPKREPPSWIDNPNSKWLSVQARMEPNPDDKTCTLLRKTNEIKEVLVIEGWKDCGLEGHPEAQDYFE